MVRANGSPVAARMANGDPSSAARAGGDANMLSKMGSGQRAKRTIGGHHGHLADQLRGGATGLIESS